MNDRTRRLLGLLSDPAVGAILAACAERDRTNKELETLTGAKPTWVKQKVELLEAYGLMRPGPLHQGSGRPAASWRATSTQELSEFERHADDFARALARATQQMVDETPAASGSLRRLRVVEDWAP